MPSLLLAGVGKRLLLALVLLVLIWGVYAWAVQ